MIGMMTPAIAPGQILEARRKLAAYLPRTPLVVSPALSAILGARVYLKLEICSPVGSFKARGAFLALRCWLDGLRHPRGGKRQVPRVVTASSGNHGWAVAYAARELGASATVYVSESASASKLEAIRQEGAALVRHGKDFDEAKEEAKAYAQDGGGWWLEDGEDPNVTLGTATIGAEIMEDLPETDEIIVPVGNGALIGGIGCAVRPANPDVEITGVQPESAAAMVRSFESGRPVPTDSCETIADGLASRVPVPEAVALMCKVVSRMLEVSDESIAAAVRVLAEKAHVLAEPAAAAAFAGAVRRDTDLAGKNVVLVLTGSNVDRAVLLRCLAP